MALVVHLLGPLEVLCDGCPVTVRGAKERALVVALSLAAGRPVSVEALVAAVWDRPPASADGSLRVLVTRVRKALAALGAAHALRTVAPGYLLSVDQVDVAEFERLAAQGRAELAGGHAATAGVTLRDALGLWRGTQLAETASERLRAESARWEQVRLDVLEGRLDADLAGGRHDDVAAELVGLCAEHPLRERLWALRIVALYRCGRQADALSAFHEVRAILDEELGLRPGPELRQLEAAVLTQDDDLLAAPVVRSITDAGRVRPLRPSLAALRRTAMVGRAEAMAALRTAWASTITGQTGLALISGEPGAGKSRLLAEMAAEVHGDSGVVLYGTCDAASTLPYQPVTEWLAQALDERPDVTITGTERRSLAVLAALSPTLAEFLPRTAMIAAAADSDGLRYEIFAAATAVLRRLGDNGPLLLLCDDLHWGDLGTVQLIRHLLQRPLGRVLVIAAHRDSEDPTGPLVKLLGELSPQTPVTRLQLQGLTPAAVEELVTATAGLQSENAIRDLALLLHQATDGNPFFLVELLAHMRETGALTAGPAGVGRPGHSAAAADLPPNLRAVLRGRLARLGPETRQVLSVAAVIGQEFGVDALTRSAGVDEDRVLDSLEAAGRASFVAEDAARDDADGSFRFAHALIQKTLYEDLGRARRARLHARVVDALEEVYGPAPEERVAELARHALAGVRPNTVDRAVRYGFAAGQLALNSAASADALHWFTQVMTLIRRSSDGAARARCLVGLGHAQRMAGDPQYRDTLLAAARLAVEVRREDLLVEAALAINRGFFSGLGHEDTERIRLLEQALGVPDVSPARRARLCAALSAELSFHPDVGRRQELANEAVRLARASGDPAALLDALIRPDSALMVASLSDERMRRLDEAVLLAEEVGDRIARFLAIQALALASLEQGSLDGVIERLTAARMDAGEVREPTTLWMSHFVAACFEILAGDLRAAEREADEALAVGMATGQGDAAAIHNGQLFVIRWHQGRLGELLPAVREVASALPGVPSIQACCALVEVESGDVALAQQMLAQESRRSFDYPDTVLRLPALTLWAGVAAELGDRGSADLLYHHLRPWHGFFATSGPTPLQAVALALARLAVLLDRPHDAERHFAEAWALHERVGSPFGLACTELHWGIFAAAREDPAGEQRLRTAADRASSHGYQFTELRARRALAQGCTGQGERTLSKS